MSAKRQTQKPQSDVGAYRRCLGEYPTGVAVVTTERDGAAYGMTSNSFASVSLDPALVLWSLRRESTSFAAFEGCGHFAVNVLATDQLALAQRFAKSGPDKFAGVPVTSGMGGAPLLEGVAAAFECRLWRADEAGDHLILIGEVEGFHRNDRQPLLFSKGRYAMAADHPETRPLADPAPGPPAADGGEEVLSNLLIRAYSAIAVELERGRAEAGLGISMMEARLLRVVARTPGRTLERVRAELMMGPEASRSVLDGMIAGGFVLRGDDGGVRLSEAGDRMVAAIVRHARAREEILFRGVPAQDMESVVRVLSRLAAEPGA
ncbi:MAG: hypothetical protein GC186_08860 [Rhodobacteraceae bacterium]|nr:hypothetical protein [Paracoccaceae bacterium]